MAADFLSALVDFVDANGILDDAGLTPLRFGVAAEPAYPYLFVTQTGSKIAHRDFTGSYCEVIHYRFSVVSTGEDEAATLGAILTDQLDPILTNPLTFDNGKQTDWLRDDPGMLMKLKTPPVGGPPYLWTWFTHYRVKVARQRPS